MAGGSARRELRGRRLDEIVDELLDQQVVAEQEDPAVRQGALRVRPLALDRFGIVLRLEHAGGG
ncbi:hypothetical protein ACWDPI_29130, partial [Streptomyces zhihengii]